MAFFRFSIVEKASQLLGKSPKTRMGLLLSYLPLNLRQLAFEAFRQLRPKDYAEQVYMVGYKVFLFGCRSSITKLGYTSSLWEKPTVF